MSPVKKSKKNLTKALSSRSVNPLYRKIQTILEQARVGAIRSINSGMVQSYWLIGRAIVEEEQKGKARAGYGKHLLENLSDKLRVEFGKGFTVTNLRYMRSFYLIYPRLLTSEIHHTMCDESNRLGTLNPSLSWSHYRFLIKVESDYARSFYENETSKYNWSARELERQINSLLFERLAKSRDKKGLMKLALKGQEIEKPIDVVKDPFVLEFLNLPESHRLVESKVEEALLNNLQSFLLELGQGFAFVSRQERLSLDGDHFYVDLVFYHTVLKCYVLIDLKTGKISHADLGQMQFYVNYFDEERLSEGDNPTIGIVLGTKKNDAVVKYTIGKGHKRIFASRYKFHLPTEKELADEIKRELKALK